MSVVWVSGAVANKPGSAGEAWVRMSWVRGLDRLGLDVRFVEEVGADVGADALRWFDEVAGRFGIAERATLLRDGDAIRGPALDEAIAAASEATLVNISGHLTQ